MPETLTFTGELVVVECWCGTAHAIPSGMRRYQVRQHESGKTFSVYCPHGHAHSPAGESKADRLERERDVARNTAATRAAERDQAEASARAHKGAATKARKKAAAGVCPVPGCGRTVKQLADHVATKHPTFDPAAV